MSTLQEKQYLAKEKTKKNWRITWPLIPLLSFSLSNVTLKDSGFKYKEEIQITFTLTVTRQPGCFVICFKHVTVKCELQSKSEW